MAIPKSHNQPVQQSSPSFFWPLLIILLFFSALCIYTPHTKNYSIFNRTWGFDHILFYGTPAKISFFLVCFAIILPYTNNLILTLLSKFAEILSQLSRKKILLFLLVSILSFLLFYLLNVKYFFLGDFNIRMMQTMKKEFVATEYLTMRLLYSFTTFGAKYGYTHEQLFKLYSYIAGGFFIFISLLIADLAGKTTFQKIVFFLAQSCTSLLLVFCGYVEVYATPVVLLSLYIYFGLRYLKSGKGFLFALLSLILAIGSHVLCLAALPSLLVAWYFNNKTKVSFVNSLRNRDVAFALSSLTLLTLVIAFKAKSGFLLTVSPPPSQPKLLTLFDFRHFWELLNGQILCSGLSIIFIFILLMKSIREKKQLFSEHYFLLSISGCFLLLIVVANLQRGSGDWDIMAFPAVSLNLITGMLIIHLYKTHIYIAHYLVVVIFCLNALNAFLWLQVNHTDRSIHKIERMLVTDPGTYYTARITGVIQLALTYTNNKLPREAERAALMACNLGAQDDVRSCVMYAISLKNSGKFEESKVFFEELINTRTPYIYEAYLYILEYCEKKDDGIKFDFYINKFFDSFIQNPNAFISNVNFKPHVMIKMFEILYKLTEPKKDTIRLTQINTVIEGLKGLKPVYNKK